MQKVAVKFLKREFERNANLGELGMIAGISKPSDSISEEGLFVVVEQRVGTLQQPINYRDGGAAGVCWVQGWKPQDKGLISKLRNS